LKRHRPRAYQPFDEQRSIIDYLRTELHRLRGEAPTKCGRFAPSLWAHPSENRCQCMRMDLDAKTQDEVPAKRASLVAIFFEPTRESGRYSICRTESSKEGAAKGLLKRRSLSDGILGDHVMLRLARRKCHHLKGRALSNTWILVDSLSVPTRRPMPSEPPPNVAIVSRSYHRQRQGTLVLLIGAPTGVLAIRRLATARSCGRVAFTVLADSPLDF
jgi:hypothetical protein